MPKDEFKNLQKKHGLPTYADLDHEFEIASIESKDHLLRAIRRKIEERLEYYAKLLEELLQGEPTFTNLHELRDLTDDRKEKIYVLYKSIMGKVRESMEIAIENDEVRTADYIKSSHAFWQERKGELGTIIAQMKESWEKEGSLTERQEYLG